MAVDREDLERLRTTLWDRLEDAPSSAVGPIAAQLLRVMIQLGEINATNPGSKADELAERRARRVADSANP